MKPLLRNSVLLALLLLPSLASASAQMHSLGVYSVGFTDEQKMTPVAGLWGVGFSLLSEPGSSGLRTSIAVFDTEVENRKFDYEFLRKNSGEYYKGRKNWLKGVDGSKWLGEVPFTEVKTNDGTTEGYRIGFKYEIGGVPQIQYSYYFVCSERIFLVKALASVKTAAEDTAKIERVVSGFKCERGSERIGRLDAGDIQSAWKTAKSTSEGKLQAIEALREFMAEYELAHASVDGADQDHASTDGMLDPVEKFLRKYIYLNEANADAESSCFFAGWPSEWKTNAKGAKTCAEPQAAKGEGTTILCNPIVFGNVFVQNVLGQSATQACRAEYRRDPTAHDTEIKAALTASPSALDELIASTDRLCGSDPYRNANYGVCATLYDRIGQVDPTKAHTSLKPLPPPADIPPSQYDAVSNLAQNQVALLNEACYADAERKTLNPTAKGANGEVIDCVELRDNALLNLHALDKLDRLNESAVVKAGGKDCVNCATSDNLKNRNPLSDKALGLIDQSEKIANSCSAKEMEAQNHCGNDFLCAGLTATPLTTIFAMAVPKCDAVGHDNCMLQAATGLMEALWSTVKGIGTIAKDVVGGLLSDAKKGIVNGIKGIGNWIGMSNKIEDASSYKIVQLAKTGGGFLTEFIKHPIDSIGKFFTSIWTAVKDWTKNDVLCAKWSGAPHLSKCLEPSTSFSCLSCKQVANGMCTALGYVASKFAADILTAGLSEAAQSFASAPMIEKMLAGATELGSQVAGKFPKMMAAGRVTAKYVGKAKRIVTKGAKGVGTAFEWAAGGIRKAITALESVKVLKIGVLVTRTENALTKISALYAKTTLASQNLGRDIAQSTMRTASKNLARAEKYVTASNEEKALSKANKAVAKADKTVKGLEKKLTADVKTNITNLETGRKELTDLEKSTTGLKTTVDETLVKNAKASQKAVTVGEKEIASQKAKLAKVDKDLEPYIGTNSQQVGGGKIKFKEGKELDETSTKLLAERKQIRVEIENLNKNQTTLTTSADTDKLALENGKKAAQEAEDKLALLEKKREEVKDLTKKVGKGETRTAELEKKNEELRLAQAAKDKAQVELDANPRPLKRTPELKAKEKDIVAKQKDFDKASTKLAKSQKEIDALEKDPSITPEMRAKLQSLTDERAALEKLKADYATLKADAKANPAMTAKEQENALAKIKANTESQLKKAKAELEELANDPNKQIQANGAAFGNKKAPHINDLVKAKARKAELEKKIVDLEELAKTSEADLLAKQTLGEAARNKLAAAETDLNLKKDAVAKLEREVGKSGKKIENYDVAKTERDRLASEMTKAETALNKTKTERDVLKNSQSIPPSETQKIAQAQKTIWTQKELLVQDEKLIGDGEKTLKVLQDKYMPQKTNGVFTMPPGGPKTVQGQKIAKDLEDHIAVLKARAEKLKGDIQTAETNLADQKANFAKNPPVVPVQTVVKPISQAAKEVEIAENQLAMREKVLAKKEAQLAEMDKKPEVIPEGRRLSYVAPEKRPGYVPPEPDIVTPQDVVPDGQRVAVIPKKLPATNTVVKSNPAREKLEREIANLKAGNQILRDDLASKRAALTPPPRKPKKGIAPYVPFVPAVSNPGNISNQPEANP